MNIFAIQIKKSCTCALSVSLNSDVNQLYEKILRSSPRNVRLPQIIHGMLLTEGS